MKYYKKYNELGGYEITENTVLLYRPKRPMGEKELAMLTKQMDQEAEKIGVKAMMIPYGADFVIEEPGTDELDKLTEDELRAKGKDLKINSAHNMGLDKLKDKIRDLEK